MIAFALFVSIARADPLSQFDLSNYVVPVAEPVPNELIPDTRSFQSGNPPVSFSKAAFDRVEPSWTAVDAAAAAASTPTGDSKPHASSIQLRMTAGIKGDVGDYLKFVVPHSGETVVAIITKKSTRDGITTYSGALNVHTPGTGFAATTSEKGSVYVLFNASDGSYEASFFNDSGWITSTTSLLEKRDPKKPDYLVPDRQPHSER